VGDELTWRGKLGFGGACVACCAVPMLVLTGVLSAGAALVGGISAGSIILVGLVAYSVASGRAGGVKRKTRLATAAAGTGLAAAGLSLLGDSDRLGRSLVSGGVAVVAVAALLALRPEAPAGRCAPPSR
jgi:hypothetical protein